MRLAVIIPAGGRSERFNRGVGTPEPIAAPRSKLDEDLGGRPVLQRAVELFTSLPEEASEGVSVEAVIVAGPHDDAPFAAFELRHGDRLGLLGARLCRGGLTHRYETVRAALRDVRDRGPADVTHVAIHDAARPITPPAVLARVLRAARVHPAAVPAVAVGDTLKRVDPAVRISAGLDPLAAILGDGGDSEDASATRSPAGWAIAGTVDRANLWAVQTPQVFEVGVIMAAYAQADLESTDDATLVERLFEAEGRGRRVVAVEGDPRNVKITTPADVALVRALGGFAAPAERATHKRF